MNEYAFFVVLCDVIGVAYNQHINENTNKKTHKQNKSNIRYIFKQETNNNHTYHDTFTKKQMRKKREKEPRVNRG